MKGAADSLVASKISGYRNGDFGIALPIPVERANTDLSARPERPLPRVSGRPQIRNEGKDGEEGGKGAGVPKGMPRSLPHFGINS